MVLGKLRKSVAKRGKRRAEEKRIYKQEKRKQKLKLLKEKARRDARREVYGGGRLTAGLKSLGIAAFKELTKPPPKRKRKGKKRDPFDMFG